MTIIDRPAPARHRATTPGNAPTATPARPVPAPLGGGYVSTNSPRTGSEGSYVTRGTTDHRLPGAVVTRGTYVTTTVPSAPSGGSYTYTG